MSKKNEKEEIIEETSEETAEVTCEMVKAEYEDKLMRLAAEYDNFRKRTIKERDMIAAGSVSDAVTHLLPAMDNLARAIAALDGEDDNPAKQGFMLIARQFDEAFANIGIEKIPAVGTEFDPNLHNAVMHVDDDSVGDNMIVEELMPGYKYKEKIIRHSMVKVAN
ncbi:MAG: nucleotide exchange factor GrpE [Clostridia bacterium]|nr:nucleotide exchange factor GrpE [Clostridia bacterium]